MSRHSFFRLFRTASLLMALVAIGLLSAITTMHFAIHGAEVQVPALKGMTVAEARNQAAGLGLSLGVDNRYYSADVGAGHILTQSPAPGSVVRRGWRVRVSESLGPQKVDVPDTVGSDTRVAAMHLERAGLEAGSIAQLPFAGAAPGAIIAQDPPAHAQGIARPSVNLLVAAPGGDVPDGFVMPSLVGLPVVTAQTTLTQAGLKPGTPRFVNASATAAASPPAAPGAVIAQQPVAGARVDVDTAIVLNVAK
jgi:eukaryotic-like serine/threonine-protein kinase